MAKIFEKDVYDKFNGPAVKVIREHLDNRCFFTKAIEDMGVDIQAIYQTYHEVEVKTVWKEEYKDLQIPHRKSRLFDKYPVNCIFFWVFIKTDLSLAYKVRGDIVKNSRIVTINTSNAGQDRFYKVPISSCQLVTL